MYEELHWGPVDKKIGLDPLQSQYLHLDTSGFLICFKRLFYELVFSLKTLFFFKVEMVFRREQGT